MLGTAEIPDLATCRPCYKTPDMFLILAATHTLPHKYQSWFGFDG